MNPSERSVRTYFQFGPFHVDVSGRALSRNRVRIPVASKAFDTLIVLLEHQGHVLDKKTMLDLIWPNTAVEENNLAQSVSALRKALGEHAGDQRYIATVPGHGYSFVAPVTETVKPDGHRLQRYWLFVAGLVSGVLLALALVSWLGHRQPTQSRPGPLTGVVRQTGVSLHPCANCLRLVTRASSARLLR